MSAPSEPPSEPVARRSRQQRRIPTDLRKRAVRSCDLCRVRRCKCVPSGDGRTCTACRDQREDCSYTAPRKSRLYCSWEVLSDRFRCLDAVVRGAFPDHPTSSVDDLMELGAQMGYNMPELTPTARADFGKDPLLRSPAVPGVGKIDAPSETSDALAGGPPNLEPRSTSTDSRVTIAAATNQADISTREGGGDPGEQNTIFKDPSDGEHYIGPSGTLNFWAQLWQVFKARTGVAQSSLDTSSSNTAHLEAVHTLEAGGEASDQQKLDHLESQTDHKPSPVSVTSLIARDFVHSNSFDYNCVLSKLPLDDVMELLIHSYFKFAHDDFPLFQRPSFEKQYEIFVTQARHRSQLCSVAEFPTPDPAWVACLYMVIVLGSISNPNIGGVDHASVRAHYAASARALLPQLVCKCTLSSVRALLLLALFLHNNSERNAAWNLTGTAIRLATALGLHRPGRGTILPSKTKGEQGCRRLVLHTLYSFEAFLSTSLGRPSGFEGVGELKALETRDAWELVDSSVADPAFLAHSWRLSATFARTNASSCQPRRRGVEILSPESILSELDAWKRDVSLGGTWDLPVISHLGITGRERAVDERIVDSKELELTLSWRTRAQLRALLLLHIRYHYIALVASRQSLLSYIAATVSSTQSSGAASVPRPRLADDCVYHAHQLSYNFLLLDSFKAVSGSIGLDVFYGYWAGMILNLARLRPLEDCDETDTDPHGRASVEELVIRVRDAIRCAVKGGTMKRISNVMDTFIDWAGHSECQPRPGGSMQTDPADIYATWDNLDLSTWELNFGLGQRPPPSAHSNICVGQSDFAEGMGSLVDFGPMSDFGNPARGELNVRLPFGVDDAGDILEGAMYLDA